MRSAETRPDGSLAIQKAVNDHLVALNRYFRFKNGESFADIAVADNITPDAVKVSVRQGRSMYEAEQIIELRDLKHQGAIATERIRKDTREATQTLIVDQVVKLLKGDRTVAEVNKSSGEVTLHTFTDPDVISMGLEHARKIISIDERPAQNQTYVNIQNNQQNITENQPGGNALTYEERLKRIRSAQTRTVTHRESHDVIEAEVVEPQTPEAEIPPAEKPDDWEQF